MSRGARELLVLGVGNDARGDDAAGLLVARRLAALGLPGVTVRELSRDGAEVLESWQESDAVVLVDATVSGAAPGTVRRLDAGAEPVPARTLAPSTHALGVAQAIELGRVLGRLPRTLVVIGIEGERFGIGEPVSAAVENGIGEAVSRIRALAAGDA